MKTYETKFKLEYPVIDLAKAKSYLTEDNMTSYLLNEDFIRNSGYANEILHIEWDLQDEESGVIRLTTKCELPKDLLDKISNWIQGQNSDGLGEGFEQQSFAEYVMPDDSFYGSSDPYEDEEDYEEDYVVASFDWSSNDYPLELVKEW